MENVAHRDGWRMAIWLIIWWLAVRWSGQAVLAYSAGSLAILFWLTLISLGLGALCVGIAFPYRWLFPVGWTAVWLVLGEMVRLPAPRALVEYMHIYCIVVAWAMGYWLARFSLRWFGR